MSRRLCIILLVVSGLTSFSQTNQSLYFNGNVGMNSLSYSISGGTSKPKLGYGGKIGYIYHFTPNWGIGTGVGFSFSATNGYLNGTKISIENQIDDEGDLYRGDFYFRNWQEKQTFFIAEVPLFVHYQYDFGLEKRRQIYIYLGAKCQLPLMAKYQVTDGEIEKQGYYDKWNIIFFKMPNHGFGTEKNKGTSGVLSLPINVSASLGIGFSFEVSKIIDIYVGGTFDYGFMNLKSENQGDLLSFDKNNQLQYRGILLSSITKKANLISVQGEAGIRIAIGKPFTRTEVHRRR